MEWNPERRTKPHPQRPFLCESWDRYVVCCFSTSNILLTIKYLLSFIVLSVFFFHSGPNAQLIVQNWKHASPIEWITLQTCLGRNFLIVVQKINKSDKFSQFYGTVKIFGRQEDADRFEFRYCRL